MAQTAQIQQSLLYSCSYFSDLKPSLGLFTPELPLWVIYPNNNSQVSSLTQPPTFLLKVSVLYPDFMQGKPPSGFNPGNTSNTFLENYVGQVQIQTVPVFARSHIN